MTIQVGSIVRCKRDPSLDKSPLGLAVVATTGEHYNNNDDNNNVVQSVCLIFEPYWPQPISPCTCRDYFITPKKVDTESEQEEATVDIKEIQECLPFELDNRNESTISSAATWKDHGDLLLRLGDPSSATSYYERALYESHCISIGGSVIVNVEGFTKIAEIDCIEEDTVDITIVQSGEEKSIKKSAVLLGIMESDPDNLQERILLNLARCMLQISSMDHVNRNKYLKSAVLATTLVITISQFQQGNNNESQEESSPSSLTNNAQTALILRSKAWIDLSKWTQAKQDATKLAKAGNAQGNKLLATIDRKKKFQAKTDKKLAKEMCRLVQQSATETTNNSVRHNEEEEVDTLLAEAASPTTCSSNLSPPFHSVFFSQHVSVIVYYLIIPLLMAVLMSYLLRLEGTKQ
jgi:hypothetical protein